MYLPLPDRLVETRKTEATSKLRVTILYECLDDGKRAKRFSDELAADQTLELSAWSFRVLGIRDIRNAAASTAATADLVIFSLSGERLLSASVRKWIEMWNWLIDRHSPTVVVLFTDCHSLGIGILVYLRRAIADKKLQLFVPPSGSTIETKHGDAERTINFPRAAKSARAVEARRFWASEPFRPTKRDETCE